MSNVIEIGPIAEVKQILKNHIWKICRGNILGVSDHKQKFEDCLRFFDTYPKIEGLITDAINSLNYSIDVGVEHFRESIIEFIYGELTAFSEPPTPLVA
jgi:hypothetical protein